MKKNKIVGALALMMGISPAFAVENKAADFQASAQIENTCLIEAGDVNFGQVYAPLTQQGSKSEMRVLCSKGTSYTVDLNYGGNFVDPNANVSSEEYTFSMSAKWNDETEKMMGYGESFYRVYKNGKPISSGYINLPFLQYSQYDSNLNGDNNLGDFACNGSLGYTTQIMFYTQEAADLLAPGSSISWTDDINGICSSGTSGRANKDNFNKLLGGSKNNKGAMVGAMKGNALAYQIAMPGDINKPWISNVNAYQATASGEFDKIEINARIMPDSSSSLYPAQDSYFDTVTAVISY